MAATSPTGIVVFKGNQTEILALVNPKAKWKEAERLLVAQASAQHHILPQLRLHVDLQNRVCGAKTIGKLERICVLSQGTIWGSTTTGSGPPGRTRYQLRRHYSSTGT